MQNNTAQSIAEIALSEINVIVDRYCENLRALKLFTNNQHLTVHNEGMPLFPFNDFDVQLHDMLIGMLIETPANMLTKSSHAPKGQYEIGCGLPEALFQRQLSTMSWDESTGDTAPKKQALIAANRLLNLLAQGEIENLTKTPSLNITMAINGLFDPEDEYRYSYDETHEDLVFYLSSMAEAAQLAHGKLDTYITDLSEQMDQNPLLTPLHAHAVKVKALVSTVYIPEYGDLPEPEALPAPDEMDSSAPYIISIASHAYHAASPQSEVVSSTAP